MRRAERHKSEGEKKTPRTLMEVDYLLLVNDEVRQGALRFSTEKKGLFLSNENQKIPPLVELPKLLSATEHFIEEKETDEDLKLLLAPGSSLGGARPKASVRDRDGTLAFAKFPHIYDETRSYLEIVGVIRLYDAKIKDDMEQLWRRIVFNIMISNTDDHLRNHAFLYENSVGWCLSPAYDLNPVPVDIKSRVLSTMINFDDGSAFLKLILSVAEYFDLSMECAKSIVAEVANAVSTWQVEASRLGIKKAEIIRMKSAFEHNEFEPI